MHASGLSMASAAQSTAPNAILWWWLGAAVLILVLAIGIGLAVNRMVGGILIDTRGRYSLTQFQIVLWTLTIFSLIAGTFFGRWQHHVSDPLNFSIPSALWGVLGISVGSTVLSMSVKATNDSVHRTRTAVSIPGKSNREAAAAAEIAAAGTGPTTDLVAKAVATANDAAVAAAAKTAAETNAVAAAGAAQASRAVQVVQPEQVAGDAQAVAAAQAAVRAQADATAQADQAAEAALAVQTAATDRAVEAAKKAEAAQAAVANSWKPRFVQIFMQEQGEYADEVVDVTKFQNFLLTVVLVIAYIGSVIAAIHHAKSAQDFNALPGFQTTFLTLLAISHGAYITGKAIPQQGDPQHNLDNRPI